MVASIIEGLRAVFPFFFSFRFGKVFDVLRSALLQYYKDETRRCRSQFVAKWSGDKPTLDPFESLRSCAVYASRSDGWDAVAAPLMNFVLELIDRERKGATPLFSTAFIEPLAVTILHRLFSAHAFLREELLNQLISRVITR